MLEVFHYDEIRAEATPHFFRETLAWHPRFPRRRRRGCRVGVPARSRRPVGGEPLTLHDRPPPRSGEEPSTAVSIAIPGYLDAMGIPLRAGRWFDERDDAEAAAVAVVNETLASQQWPDGTPSRGE